MSIKYQFVSSGYLTRLAELSEYRPPLKAHALNKDLLQICAALKDYGFDDLDQALPCLLQAKTDFNYVWCLAEVSRQLS